MSLPQPSTGDAPCRRRSALAATALTATLVALSGCAAGNNAATLQIRPDNAMAAAGDIKVQNVNVITQPDGPDRPAVVTATIFNNGTKEQTLESVTVGGDGVAAKLSPAKGPGPLTIPARGSLVLGGKGNASAVIGAGEKAGRDGDVHSVTFDFSETGKIKLKALVVPAKSYYKDYGPSGPATPEAEPEPTTAPPSSSPATSEEGNAGASDPGPEKHTAGH